MDTVCGPCGVAQGHGHGIVAAKVVVAKPIVRVKVKGKDRVRLRKGEWLDQF